MARFLVFVVLIATLTACGAAQAPLGSVTTPARGDGTLGALISSFDDRYGQPRTLDANTIEYDFTNAGMQATITIDVKYDVITDYVDRQRIDAFAFNESPASPSFAWMESAATFMEQHLLPADAHMLSNSEIMLTPDPQTVGGPSVQRIYQSNALASALPSTAFDNGAGTFEMTCSMDPSAPGWGGCFVSTIYQA